MTSQDLDDLLAAARARPVPASPEFLARTLDGAYAAQPMPASANMPPRAGRVWAALIGWASGFGAVAAGMTTATLAGFWIGFAQPAPVAAPVASLGEALQGGETVDLVELIPSLDGWLTEG